MILIPSAGATWEEAVNSMKSLGISEEELCQLVGIVVRKERLNEKAPPCVIHWTPENLDESYEIFLKTERAC